jgi:c-di-GMP-binding flagellar brake protein YcgR
MSGGSSLRHSPRYRIVVPAQYQATSKGAPASHEGSGWTRNLSETGGCLELTEAFVPGTLLGVVLLDEGGQLALEAEVVWVGHPRLPSGGTLHGVGFRRITPDQRQALQGIIQRKRRQRSMASRIPVALPAQCRSIGASSTPVRGWTGDLSQEGCLLLLPDRLSPGTLIALTLTTPRGDFTAEATVVWVEPSARVLNRQLTKHGVQFVDASAVQHDLLDFILDGISTPVAQEPCAG